MPKKNKQNKTVSILVYEGLCFFEFGIAMEVFTLPRPEFDNWYDYRIISTTGGPVSATGGIRIEAPDGLEELPTSDLIIIPGWEGIDVPVPEPLREMLIKAHDNGARIATICSGVFVLADIGLLAGKQVTTHWRYAEALEERYPELKVDPDVLYIDEGDILTSAGSAAGLDLSLHIVRQDFGVETANEVARRLVLPAHREGGQAQFIPRPLPKERGGHIAPLLDQIRERLEKDWSVKKMADEAGMSERTLLRRFKETMGDSPHMWLIRERLQRAKELLESTRYSVDEIAETVGFGTAELLRHHFRRNLGQSPLKYRALFQETGRNT